MVFGSVCNTVVSKKTSRHTCAAVPFRSYQLLIVVTLCLLPQGKLQVPFVIVHMLLIVESCFEVQLFFFFFFGLWPTCALLLSCTQGFLMHHFHCC